MREKRRISGTLPSGGVGGFALPDDALVGVNADVNLVAVDAHFGGADFCDLQLGAAVRRHGRLRSFGDGWHSQHAGQRHERRLHERSARERCRHGYPLGGSRLEQTLVYPTARICTSAEGAGRGG